MAKKQRLTDIYMQEIGPIKVGTCVGSSQDKAEAQAQDLANLLNRPVELTHNTKQIYFNPK